MIKGNLYFKTYHKYVCYCEKDDHYRIIVPKGEVLHDNRGQKSTKLQLNHLLKIDRFDHNEKLIYHLKDWLVDELKRLTQR